MRTAYNIHLAKPTEGQVEKTDCTRRINLKHTLKKRVCKYRIELIDPKKISARVLISP
jgi:hypothetical protein